MSFILGKKVKMGQIWKDHKVVPVTFISTKGNKVSTVRTKEKDGYAAVQISFGRTKHEFKTKEADSFKTGDPITASSFKEGDKVKISGLTKGRGYQGVVKRHGFGGGPKTHGQKNRLRHGGSLGSTAPQRVVPGRKMAGHMGVERVTISNLEVVSVNDKEDMILIKGAVPGNRGGVLEVRTQ
jgi:large subunit ribosomal protein L3